MLTIGCHTDTQGKAVVVLVICEAPWHKPVEFLRVP